MKKALVILFVAFCSVSFSAVAFSESELTNKIDTASLKKPIEQPSQKTSDDQKSQDKVAGATHKKTKAADKVASTKHKKTDTSHKVINPPHEAVANKVNGFEKANDSSELEPEVAATNSVDSLEQRFKEFTQNRDNPVGSIDWMKFLRFGGLLNVEAYDYTDPSFQVLGLSHSSQLSLATALLNIDALVNDWVKGHMGLFYSSTMSRYYFTNGAQNNSRTNGVILDEGYVTIANFASSPFFLRTGQMYLPFGTYHRYPISESLTQQLSETRSVAAEVGFNDKSGLTGSVTALDGLAKTGNARQMDLDNYVVALSYENRNHPLGFNIGGSYINNMIDVGSISYNLPGATYTRRVAGVGAHLDLFTGPFDFQSEYISATREFSSTDFMYQVRPGRTRGAKPRAVTFKAGYAFKTKGHDSRIALSYQMSSEARNINGSSTRVLTLPRNRMSVGYGIEVLKNTIVAAEFRRDHDYSKKNGASNRYDNAVTLRLTVLV